MSEKHVVFIGRYVNFHAGHKWLIQKGTDGFKKPALVLVRDTDETPCVTERAGIIHKWIDEKNSESMVQIIPDIEGVIFGRGVGYYVKELVPPKDIGEISGTKIRENIKNKC